VELRHLRYFIAVAEQLNFSRAAEELHTAQPSLSQQIRQLEREIGVELFDREGRRVALTAAGSAFLAEARALVARLNDAVERTRETARGLRGELRIAYAVSAMVSTLPTAIREYRLLHPDVRITLQALDPASVLAALQAHDVDAGVYVTRGNLRRYEEIVVRRIGSMTMAVVLPATHPLAGRRSISLDALAGETLIAFARNLTDMHDVVIDAFRERGVAPARIEDVERMETLLGLVAAGEGVAIVPRVYESFRFEGLRFVGLTPAPKPLAIVAASARRARSPLARDFVDLCERLGR
jgi:DNA-binding transcriptional LysR family regulator